MEPDLALAILDNYIVKSDMILFTQQLNAGMKNSKMVYRHCKVLINSLSLKACQLF